MTLVCASVLHSVWHRMFRGIIKADDRHAVSKSSISEMLRLTLFSEEGHSFLDGFITPFKKYIRN